MTDRTSKVAAEPEIQSCALELKSRTGHPPSEILATNSGLDDTNPFSDPEYEGDVQSDEDQTECHKDDDVTGMGDVESPVGGDLRNDSMPDADQHQHRHRHHYVYVLATTKQPTS